MDPIDRDAAIKELRALADSAEIIPFTKAKEYAILILQDAQKRLLKLPSVQPERKTGRWIYNSPVTMKCEQCGYVIKDWEWNKANYCAGCGADMRGEQDAIN